MTLLRKRVCVAVLLTITIGFSATVILLSVNEAGKAEILRGNKHDGETYLLYLVPKFFAQNAKDSGALSHKDVTVLEDRVPQIKDIALWSRKNLFGVQLGGKEYPPRDATTAMMPMLDRVTPALKEVMGLELIKGRFIKNIDLCNSRPICVIGGRLHKRLGGGNVIGEELTVETIGTDASLSREVFTIVGVLQEELPVLAALPDKVFWDIVPYFIDLPKPTNSIKAFQALQREQLVLSRLAVNDTVFVPWSTGSSLASLIPCTLVYIRVSLPSNIGRGEYVVDQETMAPRQEKVCSASCQECVGAFSSILYYMPQGLMEVSEEIRTGM